MLIGKTKRQRRERYRREKKSDMGAGGNVIVRGACRRGWPYYSHGYQLPPDAAFFCPGQLTDRVLITGVRRGGRSVREEMSGRGPQKKKNSKTRI